MPADVHAKTPRLGVVLVSLWQLLTSLSNRTDDTEYASLSIINSQFNPRTEDRCVLYRCYRHKVAVLCGEKIACSLHTLQPQAQNCKPKGAQVRG